MKRGMTIEYLKCRADLNFEVDFRVNSAIGMIVSCDQVGSYFSWIKDMGDSRGEGQEYEFVPFLGSKK